MTQTDLGDAGAENTAVVFYPTGRPPRLGALDAVAPEGSVAQGSGR